MEALSRAIPCVTSYGFYCDISDGDIYLLRHLLSKLLQLFDKCFWYVVCFVTSKGMRIELDGCLTKFTFGSVSKRNLRSKGEV